MLNLHIYSYVLKKRCSPIVWMTWYDASKIINSNECHLSIYMMSDGSSSSSPYHTIRLYNHLSQYSRAHRKYAHHIDASHLIASPMLKFEFVYQKMRWVPESSFCIIRFVCITSLSIMTNTNLTNFFLLIRN